MSSKRKNWISSIIVIVAIFTGYYIYQNRYLVSENYEYYVYYPDIHGLLPSDPIYLKGVKVGRVSNIKYRGQESILVTMSINQSVPLQENTIAQLSASGLQGSKHIKLIIDTTQKNILPRRSELIAEYDTNVIETSTLINPMIASAKYYIRSVDSSLANINREMKNGFANKITHEVITLRENMKLFAQNTSDLKNDANNIITQMQSFKNSSDEMVANMDSTNRSIKKANSSLSQLSKTTIKQDLKTLSENIKSITKSVKKVKEDSAVDKLLNDDKLYSSSSKKIDTIHKKIKEVKEHPKPITILGN